MKSIAIIALVGIMFSTYAQIQVYSPCLYTMEYYNDYYSCETYDDWVLVFEEEFNGTSLDTSIWRNDYPWGRSLYCANEATYYTDGDNMDISNGKLTLTADEETIFGLILDDKPTDYDLVCNDEYDGENGRWFDYTSGMIFSRQQFIHGKFEIRCQIPSIEDLRPAFWLYGDCGQEIDVFEFLSESDLPSLASRRPFFSYHRKMNCINDDHDSTCTISQLYATNFSQALHTYSVEWNEHRLIWRIDNNIVLQRTRFYNTNGVEKELCGSITNQNWFRDLIYPKDDIPMWIITGFGVLDDSPADFPVDMEIEWIRVYQQIDSNGSVEICSSSDILGSTVAGQEITVGGPTCSSITIADGEFLNLVAVDGITLDSNFKVETGAIFSMKIDP